MLASRADVLAAVRRACHAQARLPEDDERLGDARPVWPRFAHSVASAGGRCIEVGESAALGAALAALPELARAKRVYSALPAQPGSAFAANELVDPRRLAGLDAALLPGAFGVAENGAVWVEASSLPLRAALWLAEHLVLVVPAASLVPDLAAAYALLRFEGPGFGTFVAGPSKTADIEQALVIGAQGPRSTTVVLVGPAERAP